MTRRRDPVTQELAEYVINRDRGCVPATLREIGRISLPIGPCRDRFGAVVAPGSAASIRALTIGHIHHGGGRAGKRPASDRRHLVAICAGHHLGDLLGTSRDVQRRCDAYLEDQEGPAVDSRPHEAIPRVRFGVSSPGSENGGKDGT